MKAQNVNRFFKFIRERQLVYLRKTAGEPKPWTKDKILQQYKFCNVYRENDRITQWVAANIRVPLAWEDDLWFALVVSRYVNWPPTLEALGCVIPWTAPQRTKFLNVIKSRQAAGEKVYSGAYIISTHGVRIEKHEYLVDIFDRMWKQKEEIAPKPRDFLCDFHTRLSSFHGVGSFMAAQVVADLKHTTGQHLSRAPDWYTFAASGPGSRRGLNRVLGRDKNTSWKEANWHQSLLELFTLLRPRFVEEKSIFLEVPHAQDLQNCLCEFDKYERVRLGEGRPRSRYPGV